MFMYFFAISFDFWHQFLSWLGYFTYIYILKHTHVHIYNLTFNLKDEYWEGW